MRSQVVANPESRTGRAGPTHPIMDTPLLAGRKTLAAFLVVVAACIPFAFATGNPKVGDRPVQVFVKQVQSSPRRVEYHYNVVNGSAFPITKLLVGHDEYYGGPRLNGYPIGWDGDTIPTSSFRSPRGSADRGGFAH